MPRWPVAKHRTTPRTSSATHQAARTASATMWGVLQGTAAAEGTGRNARPYPSSVSAIAHSALIYGRRLYIRGTMWRIVQAVFLAVGFVVAVLLLAPHRDAGRQAILSFAYADADHKLAARTLIISASSSPPGALAPRAAGAAAHRSRARPRWRARASRAPRALVRCPRSSMVSLGKRIARTVGATCAFMPKHLLLAANAICDDDRQR